MSEPDPPAPIALLQFKAGLLLAVMLLLLCGAVGYVLYARGVFEATQQLVLIADDSEGVLVGMDLQFSGFPIGRVRRIELDPEGNARILVDVPRRDAHWLRSSSVFTLVRGILGNTSLHAYSGILGDPPLEDGAERKVLVGDATAEIPRLISSARDLVQALNTLAAPGSPLSASLANLQAVTERLKGPRGALGVLLGDDAGAAAKKLGAALDRANALLARVDTLAAHADARLFGADGVVDDAQATVRQLDALLGDARATLQRVDAVLQEAQGVATNARVATTDLGALRAQVDASLRKIEHLVDEIDRKWPFKQDTELKLP